jgi:hypothetical protein
VPVTVVLDEIHLTFRIPVPMPKVQVRAIRRALSGKGFTAALHRVVLVEMNNRPALKPVRVAVTR